MRLTLVIKQNKRIVQDMLINLIGEAFPLAVLQIIIYPLIAKKIDSDAYGTMQSVIASLYLVSGTLGGTLATTRLIRESKYRENNQKGDFSRLFMMLAILVGIITPMIMVLIFHERTPMNIILTVLLSLIMFSVNYLEVGFRLKLAYKKIFIFKMFSCAGYIAGFGLFYLFTYWQIVFIVSFGARMLYCLFADDILHEPTCKTKYWKETVGSYSNLGVAAFLMKSQTYFDKLLLFPLMGGTAVSIYFAANVFGKLVIQALEPITNVVLSYLSKAKKVNGKVWRITIVGGIIFSLFSYIICMLISKPILHFFYPQWAEEAIKLVPIATASMCVSAFIQIMYPLTLKALPTKYQMIINGASVFIYVVLVIVLYKKFELVGCCVSLLISYLCRLILMLYFSFSRPADGE